MESEGRQEGKRRKPRAWLHSPRECLGAGEVTQHFVKGKEDHPWGWKERGWGHVGLAGEGTPFLWRWQDRGKGPAERCSHSGLVTEAIKQKILPMIYLLTEVGGWAQTVRVVVGLEQEALGGWGRFEGTAAVGGLERGWCV